MRTPAERRRARDFDARISRVRAADRPVPSLVGQHRAVQNDRVAHHDDLTAMSHLVERLGAAGSLVEPEDDEFRDRLRQRLVAVASVHGINAEPSFRPPPDQEVPTAARRPSQWPRPRPRPRRRIPRRVTVASGTLAGLVALSGVGFASSGANPGDPLYSVKRSRETAQLTLARTPVARGQLHLQFARSRLTETMVVASDAGRLGRLLHDMDADTRLGMSDLGTAALAQHHPAPLDLVLDFVTAQERGLRELAATSHDPRIGESQALLRQVGLRARALVPVVRCTDVTDAGSDTLGPTAPVCLASAEDDSGVSSRPGPPTASWTADTPGHRGTASHEPVEATPRGSGAVDGEQADPPSPTGSAAVDDDDTVSDPDLTAVPQSGTGSPLSSGPGIIPLVE